MVRVGTVLEKAAMRLWGAVEAALRLIVGVRRGLPDARLECRNFMFYTSKRIGSTSKPPASPIPAHETHTHALVQIGKLCSHFQH